MKLISVQTATEQILACQFPTQNELLSLENAYGKILAEDLHADRDFPPFDRVSMDGIAIRYEDFKNGNTAFAIQEIQAAGDPQKTLTIPKGCLEVMTGAVLPLNTDTVIRYEDLEIINGFAEIKAEVTAAQNIHFKGMDKKAGERLIQAGKKINASHIAVAATLGKQSLKVIKAPKVALISSGDELVMIDKEPLSHQIRMSNMYAIAALLSKQGIPSTHIHIDDNEVQTAEAIKKALSEYDILILSGGISMGKKDYIPETLEKNKVTKLFHKIAQKPGKPMWFGNTDKNLVFALPGNPVSTFLCTVRYVLPWFNQYFGQATFTSQTAILTEDIRFKPHLTYFLQVKISNNASKVYATPVQHNGSGDFLSLSDADGFIELPESDEVLFPKGSSFPIHLFRD